LRRRAFCNNNPETFGELRRLWGNMQRFRTLKQNGRRALTTSTALVVIALCSVACFAPVTPPAPPKPRADWPTAGWQIAPASEHGLDEAKLTALKPEITAQLPFLNSLLIVRDGRLVYEAYFNGYDAASLHDLRSVTKSVTSILAGIAQDRGELAGPDVTLAQLAPALFTSKQHADKQKLTLRQLLMMRSGVQWDDATIELLTAAQAAAFLQQDIVQYALAQPMAHKPGAAWNYSTLDTQLASAALEGATGRSLKDYAAERLFAPLGINRFDWQTDSAGHTVGGGGLRLTARDIAKLGYLYLGGGAWDGRQLVQPDWVRLTTTPQASGVYSATGQTMPIEWYGMGWWTWKPEVFGGQRAIAAQGYAGQRVILLPDPDMIVVTTTDSAVPPEKAHAQDDRVYDLVKYSVLPAVTDKRPANPFWVVPAAASAPCCKTRTTVSGVPPGRRTGNRSHSRASFRR
jgi:CubicO group peptidase (beta-lactamase class C family)